MIEKDEKLGLGNFYIIDVDDNIPHWDYCVETNEIYWYDGKPLRESIPTKNLKSLGTKEIYKCQ